MIVRIQGNTELKNGIYYEYDSASIPLGKGGMGTVYQGFCINAENPSEFVPVAIKAIHHPTKDLIDRAMREASIQIDHPNLLRMYGLIPNMEKDEYTKEYQLKYYLVMERIVGVSLEKLMEGVLIDTSGTFIDFAKELYEQYISDRSAFVKRIVSAVGQGLEALHNMGYVHRDVDPSNVMVTEDGKIKLIDYGVSKAIQVYNGPKLTQAGALIGKIDYAAPEIISGDVNNHNKTTDIYALGIMIYKMYIGALPFLGDNTQVMHAQMNTPIPASNISDPAIRNVVQKAAAKVQADRYQDVGSLIADIQRDVAPKPVRIKPVKVKEKKEPREKKVVAERPSIEVKSWMWACAAAGGIIIGLAASLLSSL